MYCSECEINSGNSKFCPECGKPVKEKKDLPKPDTSYPTSTPSTFDSFMSRSWEEKKIESIEEKILLLEMSLKNLRKQYETQKPRRNSNISIEKRLEERQKATKLALDERELIILILKKKQEKKIYEQKLKIKSVKETKAKLKRESIELAKQKVEEIKNYLEDKDLNDLPKEILSTQKPRGKSIYIDWNKHRGPELELGNYGEHLKNLPHRDKFSQTNWNRTQRANNEPSVQYKEDVTEHIDEWKPHKTKKESRVGLYILVTVLLVGLVSLFILVSPKLSVL